MINSLNVSINTSSVNVYNQKRNTPTSYSLYSTNNIIINNRVRGFLFA